MADNTVEVEIIPETASILMVGGGLLGAAAAYILTSVVLGFMGFSSVGPAANSFASWWQSIMPLVAKGSLFATLQSIAIGGAGSGVITVGATLGGAATAYYL